MRGSRLRVTTFDDLDAGEREQSGRIEIYEPPRKDRVYTLGFDCAHGLDGRDLSAVCVMDKTSQREGEGRARQVAEAAGWWGEERFDRIVYAMATHFNGAFVMGEAQGGGLAVLRKLWDDYGHAFMYYDKSQGLISPRTTTNPRLGWNTTAADLTMTRLREMVRGHQVEFRSVQLLEQMARLKWKPKSRQAEKDERVGDDKLAMKLDGGGSPDLIVAARLAVFALGEVQHFDPPKAEKYAPQSYGAVLGHAELEEPEDDGVRFAPSRARG